MTDMLNLKDYIILSLQDNVGLVLSHRISQGSLIQVNNKKIVVKEDIPWGHKFAIANIEKGNPILKYGQVIGLSKTEILEGEHVHVDKIEYITEENQFFIEHKEKSVHEMKNLPDTFLGYKRKNGQVGIRNYIIVLAPVNCSAAVVRKITRFFEDKSIQHIDGVVPITYGGGCAQSFNSKNHHTLVRTIAGWIENPNVVACLLVGLGCETVNIESILENIRTNDEKIISHFNIQDVGGTQKSIQLGIEKVQHIINHLSILERTEVPVEHLVLGLNCGGSDIFSGITANPALGVASDVLVAKNGTVVFAETPECNGAEAYMKSRCLNEDDKNKLDDIINWWEHYTAFNNVKLNDNLSKGNMAGGISTILEKSLGAISKAGISPICKVLHYAEQIKQRGLLFMDTPGFDPVSVTGLVAGGCNLIAFTTGRGSVLSTAIAPTVKISTNTELFTKLTDDIDLDTGCIMQGEKLEDVGIEIYKTLIDIASGKPTKGELCKMGTDEFVPWQFGEIL